MVKKQASISKIAKRGNRNERIWELLVIRIRLSQYIAYRHMYHSFVDNGKINYCARPRLNAQRQCARHYWAEIIWIKEWIARHVSRRGEQAISAGRNPTDDEDPVVVCS